MRFRLNIQTILISIIFIGQVYGQAPTSVSTNSLPDAKPSSTDNIRIQSLYDQLKKATDFENIFPQDLNREDVQNVIVEENPFLITKLPITTTLQSAPMLKLAKKVYRFDFFIPYELRSQKAVKEAFAQNAKNYVLNYDKFLEGGRKYLHEKTGIPLIHPDFFYDSTFLFIFFITCRSINPEIYRVIKDRPDAHHIEALERLREKHMPDKGINPFYYFTKKGIFNKQQKDLFLMKHPQGSMGENCYPVDYLADDEFLSMMIQKYPYSNFVELGQKYSSNPIYKEIHLEKLLARISEDYRFPEGVKELTEIELQTDKAQDWIFNNPETLKVIELPIKFNATKLEEFLKTHYKPARYFSDNQKKDPVVSAFLEKYPNDTNEFIAMGRQETMTRMEKLRCCGPSYNKSIALFLKNLPKEFLEDDQLQINIIDKIRSPENYIEELVKIRPLSVQIKKHIENKTKNDQKYKHWCTYPPRFLKEDADFAQDLKASCK